MRHDVTVDEWIAALESGDYRKARGTLRRWTAGGGWRYCCLGVLCHIAETVWTDDDLNLDVGSAATISLPELFGREIADAFQSCGSAGNLASLNDADLDTVGYTAVVKRLLQVQEEVR